MTDVSHDGQAVPGHRMGRAHPPGPSVEWGSHQPDMRRAIWRMNKFWAGGSQESKGPPGPYVQGNEPEEGAREPGPSGRVQSR